MTEEFDKQETTNTIKALLDETPVILFMKGDPDTPQCGFSSTAVQIMKACGHPFAFVDIFKHPAVRVTLKEITGWPTFPQLVVEGELIGGSDVMRDLFDEGELQALLDHVAEKDQSISANDEVCESTDQADD